MGQPIQTSRRGLERRERIMEVHYDYKYAIIAEKIEGRSIAWLKMCYLRPYWDEEKGWQRDSNDKGVCCNIAMPDCYHQRAHFADNSLLGEAVELFPIISREVYGVAKILPKGKRKSMTDKAFDNATDARLVIATQKKTDKKGKKKK